MSEPRIYSTEDGVPFAFDAPEGIVEGDVVRMKESDEGEWTVHVVTAIEIQPSGVRLARVGLPFSQEKVSEYPE